MAEVDESVSSFDWGRYGKADGWVARTSIIRTLVGFSYVLLLFSDTGGTAS